MIVRFQGEARQQTLAETNADHDGIFPQPREETIIVSASTTQARAVGGKRDTRHKHEIEILRTHFRFRIRSWFAQSPSGRDQILHRPRAMKREAFFFNSVSIHAGKSKHARIVIEPERFERRLVAAAEIKRDGARFFPRRMGADGVADEPAPTLRFT